MTNSGNKPTTRNLFLPRVTGEPEPVIPFAFEQLDLLAQPNTDQDTTNDDQENQK